MSVNLATIDKPWTCPAGQLVLGAVAEREHWLRERRTLIGSSDVARLFGVSRYGDAYSVWADKTGTVPDKPANVHQSRGLTFEDAIVTHWAQHYADFPVKVRRQGLMRSRSHPHAGATVDRLSLCAYDGQPHRCITEVKSQASLAEWADGEVPAAFQLQGLWQRAVTGRDHVHYVAMGPRFQVEHRVILPDVEAEDYMLAFVERWWATYVAGGEVPQPSAGDAEAVKRMHFRTDTGKGEAFPITDELAPHVHAMLGARADAEDAKQRYDTAATILQHAMGEATELVWPDNGALVATWRAGSTIDGANADWRKAHPDLVERYSVPATGVELDVRKLVENEPHLLASGELRRRRTWSIK